MSFILSLIATLLEKLGLSLWQTHKQREESNVANDIAAESDSDVSKQLQRWTKK
jgi:hypothetical protein